MAGPVDHDPLTPLFSPLTTLKGVGPTVGALIAKAAGGERVIDLLFHLPESISGPPPAPDDRAGAAGPDRHSGGRGGAPSNHRPTSASLGASWSPTAPGFAELVFFKFNRERQMPVGAKLLVSGKVELFSGRRTMPHPEHVVPADRPGPAARDRAGLAADRRSLAAPGGECHDAGAGPAAVLPGVARRSAAAAREMAGVR